MIAINNALQSSPLVSTGISRNNGQNHAQSRSDNHAAVAANPVPVNDAATRKVAGVASTQEQSTTKQEQHKSVPQNQTVISDKASSDQASSDKTTTSQANSEKTNAAHDAGSKLELLSQTEQRQVDKLKARDQEVKRHEAAHLAAAGKHATGGAQYTYSRGPDGRNYAVGGSVGIDTGAEADPRETLRKADQIKRAALAPAEPSAQDRAVAAAATNLKQQAQAELLKLKAETSEQAQTDKETQPTPDAATDDAIPATTNGEGAVKSFTTISDENTGGRGNSEKAETIDDKHRAMQSAPATANNKAKIQESYITLMSSIARPVSSPVLDIRV